MTTVHICHSLDALVHELADDLVIALREAQERGRDLVVGLCGGATPRPLYEHLAGLEDGAVPWHHVQVVAIDERAVPASDPASTRGTLERLLLGPIELPAERIHAPRLDTGDLDTAAREYEETLRALAGEPIRLDWVLLGLGPDGHIASLFPKHRAARVEDRAVVGFGDGPTPPRGRVTLTVPVLRRARVVHVIVTGRLKANALRFALDGETDVRRYPAHALRGAEGRVTWWLDDEADCRDGGMPGHE